MEGFDGDWDDPGGVAVDSGPVEDPGQTTVEEYDVDGDGQVDTMYLSLGQATALLTDLDGDGGADTIAVDTDGDGSADVTIEETDAGYVVTDYTTGGEVAVLSREEISVQAPDLLAALDHDFVADGTTGDDGATPDPEPAPTDDQGWSVEDGWFIGDPVGDAEHWFQKAQNGFCLPASIAQIVADYTGIPFADETVFIDIANSLGAFQVGYDGVPGIPFDKGVDILQEAGVPAELGFGNLESLASHLTEGHNIIVFIDSGELWAGEAQEDWAPDHAVVVTGIDVERGTVILSDPGRAGGDVSEYPVDLFRNAWADSAEQGLAQLISSTVEGTELAAALDPGPIDTDALPVRSLPAPARQRVQLIPVAIGFNMGVSMAGGAAGAAASALGIVALTPLVAAVIPVAAGLGIAAVAQGSRAESAAQAHLRAELARLVQSERHEILQAYDTQVTRLKPDLVVALRQHFEHQLKAAREWQADALRRRATSQEQAVALAREVDAELEVVDQHLGSLDSALAELRQI